MDKGARGERVRNIEEKEYTKYLFTMLYLLVHDDE